MRTTMKAIAACIDDMEADRPRPSQAALHRKLQDAQRRWRNSRGAKRDEAWRDMLKISKQMDEA